MFLQIIENIKIKNEIKRIEESIKINENLFGSLNSSYTQKELNQFNSFLKKKELMNLVKEKFIKMNLKNYDIENIVDKIILLDVDIETKIDFLKFINRNSIIDVIYDNIEITECFKIPEKYNDIKDEIFELGKYLFELNVKASIPSKGEIFLCFFGNGQVIDDNYIIINNENLYIKSNNEKLYDLFMNKNPFNDKLYTDMKDYNYISLSDYYQILGLNKIYGDLLKTISDRKSLIEFFNMNFDTKNNVILYKDVYYIPNGKLDSKYKNLNDVLKSEPELLDKLHLIKISKNEVDEKLNHFINQLIKFIFVYRIKDREIKKTISLYIEDEILKTNSINDFINRIENEIGKIITNKINEESKLIVIKKENKIYLKIDNFKYKLNNILSNIYISVQ